MKTEEELNIIANEFKSHFSGSIDYMSGVNDATYSLLRKIESNASQFTPIKEQIVEIFGKYMNHLPSCNIIQDWSEAEQAMSDTPERFRDESWHLAYDEMWQKQNTCTCGLSDIISGQSSVKDEPESTLKGEEDENGIDFRRDIAMELSRDELINRCCELHESYQQMRKEWFDKCVMNEKPELPSDKALKIELKRFNSYMCKKAKDAKITHIDNFIDEYLTSRHQQEW